MSVDMWREGNVYKIGWKSVVMHHNGIAYRVWGENTENGCVIFALCPALPIDSMSFDGVVFEEGPPFECTFS